MKLDNWTLFNLPDGDRELINNYRAPDSEAAIIKGLPIQMLDSVKPVIARISALTGQKLRVIYRGPRYDYTRCWVRKADARGFSVYFR